jgi:ATP-dependent Lon protease
MTNQFDIQYLSSGDEEPDFIPLLTNEDEEQMNNEDMPDIVSILPLRNTVLFPGVVIPITVGRDKSIKLIKDAYKGDRIIGVTSQKDVHIEDPKFDDLNRVGTLAHIIKMLRMPDGNTTVIIQGKKRFALKESIQIEPYFKAKIEAFNDEGIVDKDNDEFLALIGSIRDVSVNIIRQSPQIPTEASFAIKNIESPSFLINFISSNMQAAVGDKQEILEIRDLRRRAEKILGLLTKELQMLELKNQIQNKVKTDIDQQQKEYFLNQQLKQIHEELGLNNTDKQISDLRERAANMKWKEEVGAVFKREVDKLQRMNPMAAEFSMQMNYCELLLDLPWGVKTDDNFDLKRAKKILDRDHFGLEKVKERILEYLAVIKLKGGSMKSPILCLYGPPGVGKTSLGKSVAEALGRKYIRMSLGGLHDEAEIRGHRKTYIGAMPGRIIQNLRKAQSSNPVFVLDEIDKLGNSYQGDPSSALLEVLDPEQNSSFYDNFIEVDFDLSNVMFIATANSLSNVQPALLDRMEIINVSGYTIEEKVEIAHTHLLPKLIADHGIPKSKITISKKIIEKIVEGYTSESGVRNLEKKMAKVFRAVARHIAMEEAYNVKVDEAFLDKVLGPPIQKEVYQNNDVAGVVTGLAYTPVGGAILFIEVALSQATGKGGKLTLTGNLGDVMKESAVIALEYLKGHFTEFGIPAEAFDNWNVHVHVPEGATPKDGPSAGVTMLTALASAFTQRKVKKQLAMTGEITLRGKVLPVGGIKEKILAAKRAGIKEVILCEDNRKDIAEITTTYISDMKFHYVRTMSQVLELALMKEKVKNPLPIDKVKVKN